MNRLQLRRAIVAVGLTGCLAVSALSPVAAFALAEEGQKKPLPSSTHGEVLDRGLVAVTGEGGVSVSWRLLASEVLGSTSHNILGPDFVVSRDGTEVATVTDSTSFFDPDGSASSSYTVTPVVNGIPGEVSDVTTAAADSFVELPLQQPTGGVTPAGETYTYVASDTSPADVDGDGEYEYVVKWDPSNSKDNSQRGYTGEVYLDTYELDGTLLNRISLGPNIRAGAHYTQFLAYDFDKDGKSELILKTAPGTKSTTYGPNGTTEKYVSIPERDLEAGVTNDDDYRLSNAGYRAHLAEVFQSWSARDEVTSGKWPATLEEAWGIPVAHTYPLSPESAAELADYFVDVWAPTRSTKNELWKVEGFVLSGPEYLTVFDGATGRELETTDYEPARGDDGLLWGDYAMPRIEPGNRVDRFLSGVAYLDGTTPSAIFSRGYYTRADVVSYSWDGKHLEKQWSADSGHVEMTNPFNDTPHETDGTDPEFKTLASQGFHSLSVADVDADGRQEVVFGSATLDDDGSLLYSSFGTTPTDATNPNECQRFGHGDALHVTDIDPSHPGLEIMTVHEAPTSPYGVVMRDAATGDVLWGEHTGADTQRMLIGDVRRDTPGLEVWSASLPKTSAKYGLLSAQGDLIDTALPGSLQSIKWSGDLTTQIYGQASSSDPRSSITDWINGPLLVADGTAMKSSTTKPSLIADVLGDWREELVLPSADNQSLRFYVSTEPTTHRLPTLMHDRQYRVEVARQQTAYNQPSYTSYYLASDMDFSDVPVSTAKIDPGKPIFKDRSGAAKDTVKLPRTDGVAWYINGTLIDSRSPVKIASGDTVVARPQSGYRFALDQAWTWTFTSRR